MKTAIWIGGILVVALGVWKMVDDLVVFRQTVEARFATPSRTMANGGGKLGRAPRRVSAEARIDSPLALGRLGSLPKEAPLDEPPPANLLLPADIDRGPARSKARIAADKYVNEHRSAWGVREYHELRGEEYPGPLGTEVRYKVYQDGLEVLGLELRVDVDPNGAVSETGNNYLPMGRADLSQPELAPDEAVRRSGIVQDPGEVASAAMSARRVLFAGSGSEEPEVGFSVSLDGDGVSSAIVRASDGQPLARNFARR